ncbi:MAG: MFS transporter [Chloroflexi bacterium]|nr:MFS transporter [Chloroflexota bacterium]MCY3583751.1 MFS transporter [Chloroflexota bacterium]MCY3717590.1 MFS transporter [Chloroflexota bacterium]MDE2650998.1 MFS transporter [Chloroflexota bacterium]
MPRSRPRMVALRYRDFRYLWLGEMVSTTGSQMQLFAINWHIFELLRGQVFHVAILGRQVELGAEAFGLGMLGLVRVLPIVLFALLGGVLADALDRRQVMLWTRVISAVMAGVLTALTLSGQIDVNSIYLLTALGAAATALDSPARQSIVANLVKPRHLANAIGLNTLIFQIATICGPALAGLLVAQVNIGVVYGINTATFLVAIVAIALIRHRGKLKTSANIGWGALLDGIRFTIRTRIIMGTMLLDFFATLFASARTMLPIVAGDILGVGALGYGVLATAQPIGALLVGLVLSLRSELKRQGLVLLWSVAVYGLATAIFGISVSFALSYAMFALTGAGDTVSMVIRGTIRQLMTPDELRGRMVSVNMMFFMGGPQLGELEAGLVASLFGAPFAIFSGGLATVLLTGWVAWRYPSIRRYNNADDLSKQLDKQRG